MYCGLCAMLGVMYPGFCVANCVFAHCTLCTLSYIYYAVCKMYDASCSIYDTLCVMCHVSCVVCCVLCIDTVII